MPKTSPFCPAPTLRRALTLIEMLVGMAITLVMMAAVVNLFANISTGVSNRQGAMEISSELRIARQRLYNDLAGATVRTDAVGEPNGYFEIVEGDASDENPRSGSTLTIDKAISLIPSSNTVADADGNLIDPAKVTDFGALGDYDDILAFTVESKGAPFRGRGRMLNPEADLPNPPNPANPSHWVGTTIESRFAEVIWFAVENPANGSRGEPGMRTIYRRVLLIAPWVTTYDSPGGAPGQPDPIFDLTNTNFHPNGVEWLPFLPAGYSAVNQYDFQMRSMLNFQNEYDISVRLENGRIVPNTLADLSRREHRFAHLPDNLIGNVRKFPHPFPYSLITRDRLETLPPAFVNGTFNPLSSLQPLQGDRAGGDIVLTNVLAFDVRLFDPGAPLLQDATGNLVEPSNPGWTYLAIASNPPPTPTPIGFGAYVDLYWGNIAQWDLTPVAGVWNISVNDPPINYGDLPTPSSQLNLVGNTPPIVLPFRSVTYDTWTDYYETDQVDQDNDGRIDQGTNGLDDDGVNGPDDPMERETSPPYPAPLKGVQVKLRIYEPNSRAIREANVTRSMAD